MPEADHEDDRERHQEEARQPDRRRAATSDGRADGRLRRRVASAGRATAVAASAPPAYARQLRASAGCTCRGRASSEQLGELVEDGLVRVEAGLARMSGSMNCLGGRVRAHVADVVRVRGADLGVEVEVDPQVGRDRVLGAGRTTIVSEPRIAPSLGITYLASSACRRSSGPSHRTTPG